MAGCACAAQEGTIGLSPLHSSARCGREHERACHEGGGPLVVSDVGPPAKNLRFGRSDSLKEALVQYLATDWVTRRAA